MVTVPNYLVFNKLDIRKIFSKEILTVPNRLYSENFYEGNTDWCKFFNPDFNKILLKLLPLDRVIIFNKPCFWNNQNAHTDYRSIYALNVVYIHKNNNQELVNKLIEYNNIKQKTKFHLSVDSESKMEWFKIIKNTPKKIIEAGTPSMNLPFTPDEVELIDSTCIDDTMALVRVDIPHRIKGCSYQRTCFSFRFKDNFKNWEQALTYFNQLNIDTMLS